MSITETLYKHDLHLMEKSKIILVRKFTLCFNKTTSNHSEDYNFLTQAHTSSSNQNLKENISQQKSLLKLQEVKLKHHKIPLIGYSNINSLRNKITDLMVTMKNLSLDESKTDESFRTAQVNIEGYEIRATRHRDKYGGSLIEFVRRGLICKRLRES